MKKSSLKATALLLMFTAPHVLLGAGNDDKKKTDFYAGLKTGFSQGMVRGGVSVDLEKEISKLISLNFNFSADYGKKKIDPVVDGPVDSELIPGAGYLTKLLADYNSFNLSFNAAALFGNEKLKAGLEAGVSLEKVLLKNNVLEERMITNNDYSDLLHSYDVNDSSGYNLKANVGVLVKKYFKSAVLKFRAGYERLLSSGVNVLDKSENSPLNEKELPQKKDGFYVNLEGLYRFGKR